MHTMRKGDPYVLKLTNETLLTHFLGKGHYCKAYRFMDTVYCVVVEDEYMKDVIAEWVCEENPHLPKIERLEDITIKGKDYKIYTMPYYENISANHRLAWNILKALEAAVEKVEPKYWFSKPMACYGLYFNQDVIKEAKGKVPESVTDGLTILNDAASNYGSGITFEFGKRNIGVDNHGNIVFRDIIFDAEKLHKEREAKIRNRQRAQFQYLF
jgi:hypothetical protein